LGFSSAGPGFGSTFYFELPLYSEPFTEEVDAMEATHVSPLRAMVNSVVKSKRNFSFILRDSKVTDENHQCELRASIESNSSIQGIAASVAKLMGLTVDSESNSSTGGGSGVVKTRSFSLQEDDQGSRVSNKPSHRDVESGSGGSPTRAHRNTLSGSDSSSDMFTLSTRVRSKTRVTSKSDGTYD